MDIYDTSHPAYCIKGGQLEEGVDLLFRAPKGKTRTSRWKLNGERSKLEIIFKLIKQWNFLTPKVVDWTLCKMA